LAQLADEDPQILAVRGVGLDPDLLQCRPLRHAAVGVRGRQPRQVEILARQLHRRAALADRPRGGNIDGQVVDDQDAGAGLGVCHAGLSGVSSGRVRTIRVPELVPSGQAGTDSPPAKAPLSPDRHAAGPRQGETLRGRP
jgi:hypothetical protein